jgi:hypothetical protein
MKKLLLATLFSTSSLFATITIPFTMDMGLGYREDHLKMRVKMPATPGNMTYEERYDPIHFIETELTLRKVHRDIFFLVNGGFGGIGSCDAKQGPFFAPGSTDTPSFHFHTGTEAWHALGMLGYQVDLTPGRHYTVAFTPLFGYAWYYEKINRENPTPSPFEGSLFSMNSFFSHKDMKTTWKGFFVGCDLQIYPGGKVTFNITYAYHFMGLRQNVSFGNELTQFFSPGVVASQTTTEFTANAKFHGNHGHLGILKGEYDFDQNWGAILYGKILYLSSHDRSLNVKEVITTTVPSFAQTTINAPMTYKLTHLMLEVLLEASYKF